MKLYKATDLYRKEIDNFICPACNEYLEFKVFETKDQKVGVCCKSCQESFYISLPKIKKQLVYLDQWFVSNILDETKCDYFESLITKIEESKKIQRVFVVVSDTHAKETSAMAMPEKQKAIQDKFNDLADGVVANDDTLEHQYKRLLLRQDEIFHWTDILDKNPHDWSINTSGVSVRMNSFSISSAISERLLPVKEEHNELIRNILGNQCDEINFASTEEDCFEHIKSLWLLDINDAVDYYQNSIKLMNATNINKMLSLIPANIGSEFYKILKLIIKKCINDRQDLSEEDVLMLLRDTSDIPRCNSISFSLEALGLYSAIQSINSGKEVTNNRNKFSTKYGVSKQNDISHISSFAPYVDVLITDNTARDNLSHPIVKKQLSGFKCKFYSNNNISEFEEYLDDLLCNNNEENEVKMTRKLFWLLSAEEENAQFIKRYRKEIVDEVRKRLKKNKNIELID